MGEFTKDAGLLSGDPLAVLKDARQRLAEELESVIATLNDTELEQAARRKQRDALREQVARLDVALAGPRKRRAKA